LCFIRFFYFCVFTDEVPKALPLRRLLPLAGGWRRRVCLFWRKKIVSLSRDDFFHLLSFAKTIAAIHRTIVAGLERHLAGLPAFGAHRVVHLASTFTASATLAGIAAGLAALRLILEATLSIKFLFTGGKGEFLTAVFADDGFVLIHENTSFNIVRPKRF